MTEKKQEETNIKSHAQTEFESFIYESLKSGGSHCVGFKGHGKTRLLFNIASELMKTENVRVIIFDSSDAWLYGFNKIPVFNVGERDIQRRERKTTEEIEKYQLENENLVKVCLETKTHILFRLKSRNPLKNAFFVRTVINYLDLKQREEKETSLDHTNKQAIAYILEEAQNIFSSRQSASNDMLTFLTVFNEARNQKEAFFTASQRLNDFSKTIRAKQNLAIGKLSSEDISPFLRKIEKELNINFSNMKPKTWLFNGVLFESPWFKQEGKPHIINEEIKQKWLNALPKQRPKQSLKDKVLNWLSNKPEPKPEPTEKQLRENYKITEESQSFFDYEDQSLNELELEEERDLREIEEEWIE